MKTLTRVSTVCAVVAAAFVTVLLSAAASQAASCIAPPRTHAIHQNAQAIVWLRTTRERNATRKSYFGCAFSKGKTIRIVWTLRDRDDNSEDCGGTTLSSLTLRGAVVTYNYIRFAGNAHDFRGHNKDRVNLRTGKRKSLDLDERAGECA